MGLFSRKPTIFGLDIGSSAIKLVELAEGKGGFELVNFGISELPPEAIVDGALIDATTVIDTVEALVKELPKPRDGLRHRVRMRHADDVEALRQRVGDQPLLQKSRSA